MRAMLLEGLGPLREGQSPLVPTDWPQPVPGPGEVRIVVSVCGFCHTELDEIEGRTPPPRLPIILGHQIVGKVEALGEGASGFAPGDRVGVAWIYSSCGGCAFCLRGEENLCDRFLATGRDAPGGYAGKMVGPPPPPPPIPPASREAPA